MKILVCDTDPERNEDYNLKEIFMGMGLSPEIVEVVNSEEAMERVEAGEKFNLLIASYNFVKNDSYEVTELARKCRGLGIPSVFLDYPAHRGISSYVVDRTAAICVYKHDARFLLIEAIKKVLKI